MRVWVIVDSSCEVTVATMLPRLTAMAREASSCLMADRRVDVSVERNEDSSWLLSGVPNVVSKSLMKKSVTWCESEREESERDNERYDTNDEGRNQYHVKMKGNRLNQRNSLVVVVVLGDVDVDVVGAWVEKNVDDEEDDDTGLVDISVVDVVGEVVAVSLPEEKKRKKSKGNFPKRESITM